MTKGLNTAGHSQIDELLDAYLSWTTDSIDQLYAMLARVQDDSANSPTINGELHGIAHNIKGMGSSFGFPLMTNVGASLCTYLRRSETAPGEFSEIADAEVLEAHLKAMRTILENRITGDGGESGVRLLARLEEIIAQA